MPLKQRVPKLKGFNNPFRVEYSPVNLDQIAECGGLDEVTPRCCYAGLVRKGAWSRCSAVARSPRRHGQGPRVLEVRRGGHHRAGGSVTILAVAVQAWAPRRSKGNQFTNR
jgi:large subunit ribosomal protein L15